MIAEDLVLLRDGLTRLLRDNGIEVVAAVGDGDRSYGRSSAKARPGDRRHPAAAELPDEGLRAALEARRRVPA